MGLGGDDLVNFIDSGKLPSNLVTSLSASVSDQNSNGDNAFDDNVRLAKLTGAMATFDSSMDGASSVNGPLDSRYNSQPVLTAAVA